MNKLNVFNQDWCPWRYPSNWIRNARLFCRQFKWAYQRITRGFCDFDYWDFDVYLIRVMAGGLKKLADETHGFPGNEEFPTYTHWQQYLYKIVDLLELADNDELPNEYEEAWMRSFEEHNFDFNDRTPEHKEITDKYLAVENQNSEKREVALNEALDMIKHIFWHLWD